MDNRQNTLMRGWVDAGISAARFNLGRGRMLLKSLGVPMAVINRVIPAAASPLALQESGMEWTA